MRKRILLFVCMAAVALAGCGGDGYERIELSGQGTKQASGVSDSAGEDSAKGNPAGDADGQDMGNMAENAGSSETVGTSGDKVEIQIGEPSVDVDGERKDHEAIGPDGSLEAGRGTRDESGDITLLFAGDVYLSDHVLRAWETAGGISGVLDEGYREEIHKADFFMVNQEFPFSSRGSQAPDKQFTFRLPPERVEIFREMGINGVTLANNHALDFGQDALLDSCTVLDGVGILHTGAGEDLESAGREISVELSGKRIAMIGATRVIPVSSWAAGNGHPGMLATYDPAVLLERIRQLKENHDYVIVYVHWGIERDEMPQEYQRTLGRQYIDAGADLVIGAHPHVLQGIEYYEGKPVVYSLGNFVFGSSIPRTMLLKVTIPANARNGELELQVLPGTSAAGFTRRHEEQGTLEEFYKYLDGISFDVTYDGEGNVVCTE